jgi:mono/diheme cytochrome c family protein
MRTRLLVPAVVTLAAAALVLLLAPAAVEARTVDGKAIFLAQKCNMCHGVAAAGIEATTKSEKMKGPALDGLAAAKGAEWTTQYLKKEVDIEGKKHPKEAKISDDEMKALVDWLVAQKK